MRTCELTKGRSSSLLLRPFLSKELNTNPTNKNHYFSYLT